MSYTAAFEQDIDVIGTENDRTIIELTDYENSVKNDPPTVTATVYSKVLDKNLDREERECFVRGFNREDSVFFEELGRMDITDDPLIRLDLSLKERVVEILMENPWLASKIVSRIGRKSALEFPTKINVHQAKNLAERIVRLVKTTAVGGRGGYTNRCTTDTTTKNLVASWGPAAREVIISDPITENTYDEIVGIVRPLVESKQPWNVLLIPLKVATTSQESDKFLFVHSLNVCFGDPATLYKIYSMLVGVEAVVPLDPKRVHKLEKRKREILGGDDPNYMRSIPLKARMAKMSSKALVNSMKVDRNISGNRTTMWTINGQKIDEVKQTYNAQSIQWNQSMRYVNKSNRDEPSVRYVSTNDILTSWFMSQNEEPGIGCLIADIRGRHGIPKDKAGNYQIEVMYDSRRGETSTPAWIRASVKREDELLKRHGDRKLPGAKTLTGAFGFKGPPGVTIVSNWSKICNTGIMEEVWLDHPGGKVVVNPQVHFPVILDHDVGKTKSIGWNRLVVFRYSKNKLGALIMAPPSMTQESYLDILPLDKPAVPWSEEW
mmetsp:Transcript_13911/g.32396  ORF Transcript_13911/g.32396 Transcript_13911/m.32396 type:complete len:549 (+) Transcript_13911:226-1872(+)|eukprot:CAMPEP_0197178610 /NCGR_PEP_ID=MMETSP1423-20130617/3835_1 /TAXON_ID=476441 /ORGANISM="Pseudo-nitzschia heimii, Strain UNC1101" /LENGTH=548 /DNA_ID=CAMNT_0042628387 /DNA_START=190 /DNA_END=1836 /DNA_ORIENTATION=-